MACDGDALEILTDPQLGDLTTPAVITFLETRRRYEMIIDDRNASEDCDCSSPSLHDDLIDEALLAFLQGYAKSSLKADDYDLTSSLLKGLRTLHANAKILFRRMAYSRSLRPRQGRRSGDK